jgi:hypothetical protein
MNSVRPNSTKGGGAKIGDISNAATMAQPTAQPTLAAFSAAKKRRQNGASAAGGGKGTAFIEAQP